MLDCMGNKCQVCGYDSCKNALDFHHLDPTKKEFTLSSWKIKNLERLGNEAKKCVLLCCRCHRELHAGFLDDKNLKIIFDDEKFLTYKKNPNYSRKVNWDLVNIEQIIKEKTYREICNDLGISEPTLYKRLKKLNIRKDQQAYRKVKFDITKEKLDFLYNNENMSLLKISKMYDVSDTAVRKKIKKYGIKKMPKEQ